MGLSCRIAALGLLCLAVTGCDRLWAPFYTGMLPDLSTDAGVCTPDGGTGAVAPTLLNGWEQVASSPCIRWNGITTTSSGALWMVGSNGAIGFIGSDQASRASPVPVVTMIQGLDGKDEFIAVASASILAPGSQANAAVAISRKSVVLLDYVGTPTAKLATGISPSGNFTSLWIANDRSGYIASNDNHNYLRVDIDKWQEDSIPIASAKNIIDISGTADAITLIAVDVDGTFFARVDNSWSVRRVDGTDLNIPNVTAISARDANTIFYGTKSNEFGTITATKNPITSSANDAQKIDIWAVSNTDVWVSGTGGSIQHFTPPSGLIPVPIASNYTASMRGICTSGLASSYYVWAVSEDGRVFRRSN
jgi:hypothetical protein